MILKMLKLDINVLILFNWVIDGCKFFKLFNCFLCNIEDCDKFKLFLFEFKLVFCIIVLFWNLLVIGKLLNVLKISIFVLVFLFCVNELFVNDKFLLYIMLLVSKLGIKFDLE